MRRAVTALACAVASAVSLPAAAEPVCGADGHKWVAVELTGPAWTDELRAGVRAHVAAGLSPRGVDTCDVDAGGDATRLATVHIDLASRDAVTVHVDDVVTRKRLVRTVTIDDLPDDARAFAIAVAADELLRASWAELQLARTEAPQLSEPPTPTPTPSPPPPPPPPPPTVTATAPRSTLSTRFAASHYGGGQSHLGADAVYQFRIAGRLGAAAFLGVRSGLSVDAQSGIVRSRALASGAGVQFALLDPNRAFGLDAAIDTYAVAVQYDADAMPGFVSDSATGVAVYSRVGLSPSVLLGHRFRLRANLSAGAPLRSYAASDQDGDVTAVSGLELHGSIGGGFAF